MKNLKGLLSIAAILSSIVLCSHMAQAEQDIQESLLQLELELATCGSMATTSAPSITVHCYDMKGKRFDGEWILYTNLCRDYWQYWMEQLAIYPCCFDIRSNQEIRGRKDCPDALRPQTLG